MEARTEPHGTLFWGSAEDWQGLERQEGMADCDA